MANFDHAANVPKDVKVVESYSSELSFNPQSNHTLGKDAKKVVSDSETLFLNNIKGYDHVRFVSGGGTNANIRSMLDSIATYPRRLTKDTLVNMVFISAIEHRSIDEVVTKELEIRGYVITRLCVDKSGVLDLDNLRIMMESVGNTVALVSVMSVNNETGVIQPINEAIKIVKSINSQTVFHSDSCQGVHLYINSANSIVPDIIIMSMYKIGGPSTGVIMYKDSITMNDYYTGTPNVQDIYSSSVAITSYVDKLPVFMKVTNEIKQIICYELMLLSSKYQFINISPTSISVPFILTVVLAHGYEGQTVQKMLSDENIYVGSGSACSSQSKKGSHVIKAMDTSLNSFGSIRLSFDQYQMDNIKSLLNAFEKVFSQLVTIKGSNIMRINNGSSNTSNASNSSDNSNSSSNSDQVVKIVRSNTKLDIPLQDVVYNAIKVTVSELYLKGDNQDIYKKCLLNNLKIKLPDHKIMQCGNYYLIKTKLVDDKVEKIIKKLKTVSGLANICPIWIKDDPIDGINSVDWINTMCASIIQKKVTNKIKFRITTKLRGLAKFRNNGSLYWNRVFGQYIMDRFGSDIVEVDLKNNDVTIYVDIHKHHICVYTEIYDGFIGLPVSTSGKLLCCIDMSNYYESILSCHMMIGRGAAVDILIFSSQNCIPEIEESIRLIQKYDPNVDVYEVDVEDDGISLINDLAKKYDGIIFEMNASRYPLLLTTVLKVYEGVFNTIVINNTHLMNRKEILEYFKSNMGIKDVFLHDSNFLLHKCFCNQLYDQEKMVNIRAVSNSVLMLLSGGIDSPVAAYKLLKAGIKTSFIHFTTDIDKLDAILAIRQKLIKKSSQELVGDLYIVNFKNIQTLIVKTCEESYRTIMYKIFMVIIANNIAARNDIGVIGTGNSWAQVASQTYTNIKVTHQMSYLPIMSPVLGYSKSRIIDVAKKIETYELSICGGTNDCCVMYLPRHPVLKADINKIKSYVERVDRTFLDDNNLQITIF